MKYDGTWIHAKPGDFYGDIELVEFSDTKPIYFSLEKVDELNYTKSQAKTAEKNELKIEEIDTHRLRFHTKGKKSSFYSDHTVTVDHYFKDDYVRLLPTKTSLAIEEIQKLEFEFPFGNEVIGIKFNEDLETEFMQETNKRIGRQGSFLRLGKLSETLLLVFFSDIYIDKVIPIKEINSEEIKLYGFAENPFEMKFSIIN